MSIKHGFDFFNFIPHGVFVLDNDFRVLFWNDVMAQISKITTQQIHYQNIIDFYPHLKQPKYYKRIEGIFLGQPPVIFSSYLHNYLIPCKLSDNQFRRQHTIITGMPLPNSEEIFAVFSIQDVTHETRQVERYQKAKNQAVAEVNRRIITEELLRESEKKNRILRQQAEEASAAKTTFLSNMSHEMRTPLNAIIGLSEVLLRPKNPQNSPEELEIIHQSAKNLLLMINDVLDISKIEAGKIELERIPFEPHYVIRNVLKIIGFEAKRKNIQLLSEIDVQMPNQLIGDPTRLTQILLNLLQNAVKFTFKGSVHFRAKIMAHQKNTVRISFEIKDTGIGIAEDKLHVIFDSFSQASMDTTRKYGGTGLGLAIVKELTALMDGQISVDSKLNQGSVFRVEIPFQNLEYQHDMIQNLMPFAPLSIRVLVAEDNPINQIVIKKILEQWNITVSLVHNGEQAVEMLKQNAFDLILMDLHMPEQNGYEATRQIRMQNPDIPIIALTADASKATEISIRQYQMNTLISKPINQEKLYRILKNYFD